MTASFQFATVADCRRESLAETLAPMIAQSPIAQAAFAWAAAQKVPVADAPLLDENNLGMYSHADRTMYMDPRLQETPTREAQDALLEVSVHELRHAWQDQRGLIMDTHAVYTKPFLQLWLNRCLTEADAHAHGIAALAQFRGDATPARQLLQDGFHDWFVTESETYFNALLSQFSTQDDFVFFYPLLQQHIEKGHIALAALQKESRYVDILAPDYLARMSRAFGGESYLSGEMQADTRRRYLVPSAAARAFQEKAPPGAATRIAAITKARAKMRDAVGPAPRVYPLPG